ncbi:MAG: hypothetical protein IKN55_06755 [Oscillospiraceae bacterium]|nr:hypothetical protein [Oscillospiraceae bacterium]
MNEQAELLNTLLRDEDFVHTCFGAENAEAVQKLCADRGLDLRLTDVELLKELFILKETGTASQEQLEKFLEAEELAEKLPEEASGVTRIILGMFAMTAYVASKKKPKSRSTHSTAVADQIRRW